VQARERLDDTIRRDPDKPVRCRCALHRYNRPVLSHIGLAEARIAREATYGAISLEPQVASDVPRTGELELREQPPARNRNVDVGAVSPGEPIDASCHID
jgi:hypothetical protein